MLIIKIADFRGEDYWVSAHEIVGLRAGMGSENRTVVLIRGQSGIFSISVDGAPSEVARMINSACRGSGSVP